MEATFRAFANAKRHEVSDERWEEVQFILRMTDNALAAGQVTAEEKEKCLTGCLCNIFLPHGTRVTIFGLHNRSDLNGSEAIIVGTVHEGRVPVKAVSSHEHVRLRPQNMRPALSGTSIASTSLHKQLEPGTLVELTGLVSATLNGSVGEVLSGDQSERIPVRLHAAGIEKRIRVKSSNLSAVSAARALADGRLALEGGRPRDALTRADHAVEIEPTSAAANVLRLHAMRDAGRSEPRVCQAKALADAVLGMVSRCGLESVPSDVCVAASSTGRDHVGGDDQGWPRERASTYTVALAALVMRREVLAAHGGGEEPLRIALLGCRWDVEGRIDWQLLIKLLSRFIEGASDLRSGLRITLVGPDLEGETGMAAIDRDEACREMKRAIESQRSELGFDIFTGPYHEALEGSGHAGEGRVQQPHLAVILNGGVDNGFGSWGPSIASLLRSRVPCIFTGYGSTDDGTATYDAGVEPLLTLMRAECVCAAQPNPFRFPRLGMAAHSHDAFLIGVCGCGADKPPDDDELSSIHAAERAAKLDRLADLNDRDGYAAAARLLRDLRAQLLSNEVNISPEVTHGDLERWAQGRGPKMW